MTTDKAYEGNSATRPKKAVRRRAAATKTVSTPHEESTVTVTMNNPVSTGHNVAGAAASDKDFLDFLGGILPTVAHAVAPSLGIDPRLAGQTVSQVMSIFGIGGPGKAYTASIPREQAMSQLKEQLSPHLGDPAFAAALGKWMQAAVEPVQAHREGKAYQPSVDLDKNWFTDAIDSIGDAVSSVDWGQVAQVGMQVLPVVLSLL